MTKHHPEKEAELYREGDAYVVLVELSEYDPADITLRWRDGRLHVAAEHVEIGGRRAVYHRSFGFPREINDEGIEAEFDDGVLTVRLPVADRERGGRDIEIAV